MRPPRKLYAVAYKNQHDETVIQAAVSMYDVVEDGEDRVLVGTYTLESVVLARKIVETQPLKGGHDAP